MFGLRKPIDMMGLTIVASHDGPGGNAQEDYILEERGQRCRFSLRTGGAYGRLWGCSGINFQRDHDEWVMKAGEWEGLEVSRQDGWLHRSHDKTLRAVLKSARAEIDNRVFEATKRQARAEAS